MDVHWNFWRLLVPMVYEWAIVSSMRKLAKQTLILNDEFQGFFTTSTFFFIVLPVYSLATDLKHTWNLFGAGIS